MRRVALQRGGWRPGRDEIELSVLRGSATRRAVCGWTTIGQRLRASQPTLSGGSGAEAEPALQCRVARTAHRQALASQRAALSPKVMGRACCSSVRVSPPRYSQSPGWLPRPRLLPPHRRLERSDFVLWNVAVRLPTRVNAGYRQENGRDLASTFTVRCADMTVVRSSSGQNKLGSLVAMAPHFRFAAVISSPNR